MSRRDVVEQQFQNMKVDPIFEFENGEYVYVQYNKKLDRLEAGGCCNAGFHATDTMAYDHDFSLDENLAEFYEQLEEKYGIEEAVWQ